MLQLQDYNNKASSKNEEQIEVVSLWAMAQTWIYLYLSLLYKELRLNDERIGLLKRRTECLS